MSPLDNNPGAAGAMPITVYPMPFRVRFRPSRRGSPPKRRFQKAFADHGDRRTSQPVLTLAKAAPQHRPNAQQREQRRRDGIASELLRLALSGEIVVGRADGADLFEAALLFAPRQVIQSRGGPVRQLQFVVLFRHPDQAVGLGKRQCPQHHRVHHAEDGGVGADAQS